MESAGNIFAIVYLQGSFAQMRHPAESRFQFYGDSETETPISGAAMIPMIGVYTCMQFVCCILHVYKL